ncbi:MAG: hypothetical protein ACFFEK_01365 [Candidatus Thorarchaeota archaeon]
MREFTTNLRIACELGFALFVWWMALEITMDELLLKYLIIGIAIIFVPIWLFAMFGTDALYPQSTMSQRSYFTRGEAGLTIMLLSVGFSDAFREPIISSAFVLLGFLVRLSAIRKDSFEKENSK